MKLITLTFIILSLTGCASKKLKRCESAVEDESIQYCPKNVEGPYFMCEKPKKLMKCDDVK